MKVFYTPAQNGQFPNIIDRALPIEGGYIGQYSLETLEQIQLRHKGALLGDAATVQAERQAMMITEPTSITEDEFIQALECLPPEGWVRNRHTESFKMSEYYSGQITEIYARFSDTYWCFRDLASKTHNDIMHKVLSVAVPPKGQDAQDMKPDHQLIDTHGA